MNFILVLDKGRMYIDNGVFLDGREKTLRVRGLEKCVKRTRNMTRQDQVGLGCNRDY